MDANALQCHISASHIHSQRKTVLTSTASWWVLVDSWAKRRINPLSIETSPRVLAKQGSQCIYVTTFVNSIYSSTKEIHMNNLKLNLCQWSKKKKGHEEAEMWCRVSSATIEGCAWELNSSWTNDKVLHRQMTRFFIDKWVLHGQMARLALWLFSISFWQQRFKFTFTV
jgi:hypothetical protein